jgi:alpha-N-acetylglucosamine transferase
MGDKMAVLSVQSRNKIPLGPKLSKVQVKIKLMCSFGYKGIVHLYNNSTQQVHTYILQLVYTYNELLHVPANYVAIIRDI